VPFVKQLLLLSKRILITLYKKLVNYKNTTPVMRNTNLFGEEIRIALYLVEAILKSQQCNNSWEFLTSLVFPVPLRCDNANDVQGGMNFILR